MTNDQREAFSIYMAGKVAEHVLSLPDVVPNIVACELMAAGYAAITGVSLERARQDLRGIATAAMRESNRISIADRVLSKKAEAPVGENWSLGNFGVLKMRAMPTR